MSEQLRVRTILAGCVTALALAACGGGGGGADAITPPPAGTAPPTTTAPIVPDPLTPAPPVTQVPVAPGAPALTGNIALDGREWINFRRNQIGMSTLVHNNIVDIAAQGHSDYQRINDTITHDQTLGKQGFTGVKLLDRLQAAGYVFNASKSYAYGEVIAATGNGSGQYMAEELITAVYHRFVIFEPVFKEIGTGAATTGTGYNYFTANFTANNGYGPGLARGQVAVWPFNGQTAVPREFSSNSEKPDPVREIKKDGVVVRPNLDKVGYPLSVHANIDEEVKVTSFTVRPRGGAEMAVQQLNKADDPEYTAASVAAIVPLAVLNANTVYDVSFTGTVGGVPVSRTWSFTTL